MPVILEGGCRVSQLHDGDPFVQGTATIWNQIGRATGAQAVSLRVMEFAPGISPTIRNSDCDQILYRVASPFAELPQDADAPGSGSVDFVINGFPLPVGPDCGVYVRPHETFAVHNPGPGSILLVSSQCPDPDCEPQFGPSKVVPAKPAPVVPLADRIPASTADRWYKVLVDDEVGSTQVTQFVGSIPPGRAPDHFHNYEEVLFILKGEGQMWAGATHTPIAEGSCIYLPKKQVHCVENTGSGELRLLGVFYPAGSPSVRYDA